MMLLSHLLSWTKASVGKTYSCGSVQLLGSRSFNAVFKCQTRSLAFHRALIRDRDNVKRSVFYFDSGYQSSSPVDQPLPPILLLIGTCQTISTWHPLIKNISQNRRLIIPELRCCGKDTQLLPVIDSLYDFVHDLDLFLQELSIPSVDVMGFSLGGRIGLALAAHRSHLVRRLSVTGVPFQRTELGSLILQSWRSGLSSDCCFQATAWLFVLNGFSENYLQRNSRNIHHYVKKICENNDYKKLFTLLSTSHSPSDKAAAVNCVHMISCPTQVIAATADRISDVSQELRLAQAIANSSYFEIDGAGHLSPFEQPSVWCGLVLKFINA